MNLLVKHPDVTRRHLQSVSRIVAPDVPLHQNPFRWDKGQYTFFGWEAIWDESFITNLPHLVEADTINMLVQEPDPVDYYIDFGFTALLRLESGFSYKDYIDAAERPQTNPADSILHRANRICYYDNLPDTDPRFVIACDRSLEVCVLGSPVDGFNDRFKHATSKVSDVMFFQKDEFKHLVRNAVFPRALPEIQATVLKSF